MSVKSPIALVKEKFSDKKSLVEAVQKIASDDLWLGRTNESKGLKHVSNSKLLKLHATFTAVKERFGSRAKLIEAVLTSDKRTDAGYKTRLETFPVPRLWDMLKSSEKRAKAPAKGAKKTASKEAGAPAAKKAPAKKAAAKAPVKKLSPAAAKSAAIKKSK